MILHVEFTDGSNPFVSYPEDRHELKNQWEQWDPWTTKPTAYRGNYILQRSNDFSRYWVWRRGRYNDTVKVYKHLGHALAALDRKGATQ